MLHLDHGQIRELLKGSKFESKTPAHQILIVEALDALSALGIPIDTLSPRSAERTALAFLAVADIRAPSSWPKAKDVSEKWSLKTRDIIKYENEHFGERISSGSYDDIRRKDLLLMVGAGVVVQVSPSAARNSPSRAYALSESAAAAVRLYGASRWKQAVARHLERYGDLARELKAERELEMIPVRLPRGVRLELTPGEHNELQRAVIEEFLPRFGSGAELLYLGDASNKSLFMVEARLRELRFFELEHGELPDVIAYSASKNWLFLVEAVHSFGPISPIRKRKLVELTKDCTAPIVFVTAFMDRATFRKFVAELAWEQEVWIAEEPDHLIHFNGSKFLGPYSAPSSPS